jgi:hypothetical protein
MYPRLLADRPPSCHETQGVLLLLLYGLDVADSIMESVDDLDVLDVRDSVSGVTEIFHIVLKVFIMLLPNGLKGLSSRWPLVCALEVPDEHDI